MRHNKRQLRELSDQRTKDAKCLLENRRFNGAKYMAGFVVECLLKAAICEGELSERRQQLLYSHDLEGLLRESVDATNRINDNQRYQSAFSLVAQWSVALRYQSKLVDRDDAQDFYEKVRLLRECLEPLTR